ncbi:MAG: C45 family autoproteolytic acyltransferase/hydrolase [Desulfobacterales bacterium]
MTVVILKGNPYEIGYARGVLLKEEVRNWVKDNLYMIKKQSLGTGIGVALMLSRAREVEDFIPAEYREELNGLAAGSGIDYEMLLMLNVLDTVGRQFGCTSVAVRGKDGKLLRSRNLDYRDYAIFKPMMLFFYQPDQGYALASISPPAIIGLRTAMNEKGLTFGVHDISGSAIDWKGIPSGLMNRRIVQYADSVEAVGHILEQTQRCLPRMIMVTSSADAGIYEFDSEKIAYKKMDGDYLVLTNHCQVLSIGQRYTNSLERYAEAEIFLNNHPNDINVERLIDLNRGDLISWANIPGWHNLLSAIFKPDSLDFWIAIDPPPATRGRWVGFSLTRELCGKGPEPEPQIFPASD